MNRKPKHQLSKKVLYASLALLVVAGALFGYMYLTKTLLFAENPQLALINYEPATKDEVNAGEAIKENTTATRNDNRQTTGSDPTPAPVSDGTGAKPTVGVQITVANQNGNTVNIRTLIQSLSSSGTCTLNMVGPAGKSYSATAKLQAGPSTGTCMGFDIPVTSLSSGVWNITISYEDNSVRGSASKELTVL